MKSPRSAASETTARRSRPKPQRYEIEWRNPLTSGAIKIRITHTLDYLGNGQSHIEIDVVKPRKAELPITETGYRSHFMSTIELVNEGGPVAFVTAWLDREAKSRKWLASVAAKAQGDLFQWADARRVTTVRKPKPLAVTAAPSRAGKRQVVADADHIAELEMGQRAKRMAAVRRGKSPKPPREP